MVDGRPGDKSHFKPVGRHEGFIEIAHDIHLGDLPQLCLPPEDRIVEEVVVCGTELAEERQCVTNDHVVNLVVGYHRQLDRCRSISNKCGGIQDFKIVG